MKHVPVVLSTVGFDINCRRCACGPIDRSRAQAGARGARIVGGEAARSAGISAAYLNRLENDAVKKPSPHVLHQLSEALTVPYAELMRLSGYPCPGAGRRQERSAAALFADLTDDERDELLEYLAWYRARKRSRSATARADSNRRRQPNQDTNT